MEPADHLIALRRDAPALLAAARVARRDTPIAACPGWDAIDLAWHAGEVHRFWATVVGQQRQEPPDPWPPPRPEGDDDVLAFAEESADLLVAALDGADPATPVWTWSPGNQDIAFVVRRMAHETAVHRVDAERAAGRHDHEVDAGLAADGIDEYLVRMLPWLLEGGDPLGGSVHVHCTDIEGEWTVTPGPDGITVTTGHAKGDAALRGRAHDLLMALWRRDGTEHLEIFGDEAVVARLLAPPPAE